ncbi:MAG: hypothetical protein IPG71_06945 [bacterium]|nr:hypothetical protein [bacterium]
MPAKPKEQPSSIPDRSTWIAEDQLWGKPVRGDGEFLAALRSRLDHEPSGLWLALPRLASAGVFAVILVAALWIPGKHAQYATFISVGGFELYRRVACVV